jgi:hypothetical protein
MPALADLTATEPAGPDDDGEGEGEGGDGPYRWR